MASRTVVTVIQKTMLTTIFRTCGVPQHHGLIGPLSSLRCPARKSCTLVEQGAGQRLNDGLRRSSPRQKALQLFAKNIVESIAPDGFDREVESTMPDHFAAYICALSIAVRPALTNAKLYRARVASVYILGSEFTALLAKAGRFWGCCRNAASPLPAPF